MTDNPGDPYATGGPGWQAQPNDPYGPPPPPYEPPPGQVHPPGQQPPGPYGPGQYGSGGPYQPVYYVPYHPDPQGRTNAITALIVGLVCTFFCLSLLAVPTAILGGVALSKADTDPEGARKLTKWAWISLGIGVGVGVLLIIAYILLIVFVFSQVPTSTP